MKMFLLMALTFCSVMTFAGEAYSEKELKNFLDKKKVCYLVIAWPHPIASKLTSGETNYGNKVLCVSDATVNAGTIQEAKGCLLSVLNVDDLTMSSTYMRGENPALHDKSGFAIVRKYCADGGLQELVKKHAGIGFNGSVKNALVKGPMYTKEVKLISFTGKGYKEFWESLK